MVARAVCLTGPRISKAVAVVVIAGEAGKGCVDDGVLFVAAIADLGDITLRQ